MTDPQKIVTAPLTVPALLAARVRASGPDTYVASPTGALTYRDADDRSAEIARRLLAAGVGKGSRVGLFFPNDLDWVIWWLALSRIGALAIPLSTLYTPAEIAKVLRLADVGILISPGQVLGSDVRTRLEAALPGLADQFRDALCLPAAPYLRRIVLTDDTESRWATRFGEMTARVPADILAAVEAEVSPADLAVMVHTSGSTADPKGVLHTHGTLVRQTSTWPTAIRAVTRGERSDGESGPGERSDGESGPGERSDGESDQGERSDGESGQGEVRPRILCAMPFFWVGGLLAAMGALHDSITLLVLPRLDPGTGLDLIEQQRGTGVVGWPAFTRRLRDHHSFASRDLSSAPTLRDGPLDIAMTDVPDGFPVHRTMSETAGGFAYTDIAIVDDDGAAVPDGVVGELLIRGVGVMSGYNKRERAEVFDADGWYHTGDRVYRRTDDPRLFYVGRSTDLIKSGGANVSPLEVEAVISALPGVAQCVVIGVEQPERGEEVCAVVVPTGPDPDIDEIRRRSREQLSVYKVPTRWVFATDAQIPTLPSGKFDRKALLGMVTDGTLGAQS